MRWTAAFNAKIKQKKKALLKVKRKFKRLCKKHGFKPEEADKMQVPGHLSESEVNVEEFNNIAVQKELEEEEKQRRIREQDFMKRILENQVALLPHNMEDSLRP